MILNKYPGEARLFDFDFTAVTEIVAGETISTASVTQEVVSPSGTIAPLTISAASVSGAKVQVTISAGVKGTLYRLTCTITTNAAHTIVGTGELQIL